MGCWACLPGRSREFQKSRPAGTVSADQAWCHLFCILLVKASHKVSWESRRAEIGSPHLLMGRAMKSHCKRSQIIVAMFAVYQSDHHIHHFYLERCCWKCQHILFKAIVQSWTKSSVSGLTIKRWESWAMKNQCAYTCQNGYCQKDKK